MGPHRCNGLLLLLLILLLPLLHTIRMGFDYRDKVVAEARPYQHPDVNKPLGNPHFREKSKLPWAFIPQPYKHRLMRMWDSQSDEAFWLDSQHNSRDGLQSKNST
jgi:hypothetical protein